MTEDLKISTKSRLELVDITPLVRKAVKASKVKDGVCQIFIPHTTAGITINEFADPSVKRDILHGFERFVPSAADYEHAEGNAAAHIKSTITGTDRTVFIEDGDLKLGTWQGIFFCEFDGPRQRSVFLKIMER